MNVGITDQYCPNQNIHLQQIPNHSYTILMVLSNSFLHLKADVGKYARGQVVIVMVVTLILLIPEFHSYSTCICLYTVATSRRLKEGAPQYVVSHNP